MLEMEMTDTKPTLPELIEYQQRLCENNPPNPVVYILTKEILASLKELAAIKSQPVPEGYTDIKDYIAEQEKDPVRKAALDEARVRLREELAKGPVPVEPAVIALVRAYAKDGVLSAKSELEYIDSLQSALQVAQQERDEKRLQWQNWRSRMGLTASATELLERAEKAEAELAALRLELAQLNGEIPYGN